MIIIICIQLGIILIIGSICGSHGIIILPGIICIWSPRMYSYASVCIRMSSCTSVTHPCTHMCLHMLPNANIRHTFSHKKSKFKKVGPPAVGPLGAARTVRATVAAAAGPGAVRGPGRAWRGRQKEERVLNVIKHESSRYREKTKSGKSQKQRFDLCVAVIVPFFKKTEVTQDRCVPFGSRASSKTNGNWQVQEKGFISQETTQTRMHVTKNNNFDKLAKNEVRCQSHRRSESSANEKVWDISETHRNLMFTICSSVRSTVR